MKKIILTALTVVAFAGSIASASVIDFRTSPYASTFGPNTTTDVIDGVNFTFTATARGADGFRQNASGLSFGVPGNGMYSLSIVADTDVEYTSLFGRGHTLVTHASQLPFDISVNGGLINDNLSFVPSVFTSASLGGLSVNAGDILLIDVDYSALTGSSIFASATLQLLNFTVPTTTATVPVPPTVLLMLIAIPGLLGVRKYRKMKSVA